MLHISKISDLNLNSRSSSLERLKKFVQWLWRMGKSLLSTLHEVFMVPPSGHERIEEVRIRAMQFMRFV